MQKILLTGGSGLIGQRLTELLIEAGYNVNWLSRSKKKSPSVSVFLWNIDNDFIDAAAFEGVEVIIHLAGEGIAAKRWTVSRKKEIIESRTRTTDFLIKKLRQYPGTIKTIICASAIGLYGNRSNLLLTETSETGVGFLSESVAAWENATAQFETLKVRLVQLRIGIVLSNNGGAYKEMTQTKSLHVLPVMGNGKQIYSWIHIDDVCRIFLFALQNNLSGLFNAVAPFPVAQKQIMQSIKANAGSFNFLIPIPQIALRLILGELRDAVLFSQNVSAQKILNAGFDFRYVHIDEAIRDLEK